MRVSKDLLRSYNLFDNLPTEFKQLEDRQYFVMYYLPDEQNLRLTIFDYEILQQVNVSLYRNLSQKAFDNKVATLDIGFFSGETYESRDGLFYLFLKTYNNPEIVKAFYQDIMEQDVTADLNISTNAITDIYSSADMRRSLSYFAPNRIQIIMFVYDIVNNVTKKRLSKSLYGEMIRKVVNMVKYNGGVLNEVGGDLRYMVIGENAVLTEEQKAKLHAAKLLLRSMQSAEEIYKTTGWYFSDGDGKWRTNISDNEAQISSRNLEEVNGCKLYIPSETVLTKKDILDLVKNPERIYSYNYTGKLKEVLNHTTLFEHYPRLGNLPILYFVAENKTTKMPMLFYFNHNAKGGYILINGNESWGSILSILLHETQHAVQRIEGFATGGNQLFAQFVASIGGKSVRKIFASINKLQSLFKENLLNEDSRLELLNLLKGQKTLSLIEEDKILLTNIISMVEDKDGYLVAYPSINFYLVLYLSDDRDYPSNSIFEFLTRKLGALVYDLFENISAAYREASDVMSKLAGEGYKREDIDNILHSAYENLYGEMESRSVQISRYLTSEYKNYFFLTKWEHSPIQQLVVIDGKEQVIDSEQIKAAVEKRDDSYIMHFNKGGSCVPFLHELGHILYDVMVECGYKDDIQNQWLNKGVYSFSDVEEYFVSRFMGYLRRRLDDKDLWADTRRDFSINDDEEMSDMFDAFFAEETFDERLNYLQHLLANIVLQ